MRVPQCNQHKPWAFFRRAYRGRKMSAGEFHSSMYIHIRFKANVSSSRQNQVPAPGTVMLLYVAIDRRFHPCTITTQFCLQPPNTHACPTLASLKPAKCISYTYVLRAAPAERSHDMPHNTAWSANVGFNLCISHEPCWYKPSGVRRNASRRAVRSLRACNQPNAVTKDAVIRSRQFGALPVLKVTIGCKAFPSRSSRGVDTL